MAALLIGFWSVGHCLTMCGGLAIAAGQTGRQNLNTTPTGRATELLAWQIGRIASYSCAGLVAGAFGAFFLHITALEIVQRLLFVAVNLMLIGLGLHVARLWMGVTHLERLGKRLWKVIEPLAVATLVPRPGRGPHTLRTIAGAFRAGAIWGWLPCGLVYSMLITASVTGSALGGAVWMAAFGLGTIPALWLTSMASHQAHGLLNNMVLRRVTGMVIIIFGIWGLLRSTSVIEVNWIDTFCILPPAGRTPAD